MNVLHQANTRRMRVGKLICRPSKAKIVHACHAQIARRANLPQRRDIVERPKSTAHLRRPAFKKGALRDRHERRKRDAMDASGVARRTIVLASAKPCGSDVPRLTSSLRSHPQATETTKSGLREERGISRQTIAQGVPDRFGEPVVTYSCAILHRTRGCGCVGHPAFPAPSLLSRDVVLAKLGRYRAAGMRSRVIDPNAKTAV
jgi:hypothetical protein